MSEYIPIIESTIGLNNEIGIKGLPVVTKPSFYVGYGGASVTLIDKDIVLTFSNTGIGSFTTNIPILSSFLIVAGGGCGATDPHGYGGGGGGGGGVLYSSSYMMSAGTHWVIVGEGGDWDFVPTPTLAKQNGNSSSIDSFKVYGGGRGGKDLLTSPVGNWWPAGNGGSGGGEGSRASEANLAGTGTLGQGYDGGRGDNVAGAGGGGGATVAGSSDSLGGYGGTGFSCSIDGTNRYYGSGGGGGRHAAPIPVGGPRGGDGGISFGSTQSFAASGEANSGGGGGGALYWTSGAEFPGNGGSGIVIVRFHL